MSGVVFAAKIMDLRVLGPLEARVAGSALPLGPPKQQVVLAMLAVHAGRVVSVDGLVDELWPGCPPASAVANVRSYTSALRRLFEAAEDRRDRLVRRGLGYQLNAGPDELDLLAFSSCAANGREAFGTGELVAAAAGFADALTHWRGAMLVGLPVGPVLARRSAAAEEERLAITEELAEAQLALDEPQRVVRLLHEHVHMHPLRERAYALLMKALYRLGDVAGALSVYAEARTALVERLGIEPGSELRKLHGSILAGDLELDSRPTLATSHRPPVVRPAEVPADLVDFVGRDAEVRQAIDLLSRPVDTAVRMCIVVGLAGVGKTTLAVRVAHRLRSEYPDGQLFVDLRGADSHPLLAVEVLGRFLRALGVPGQAIPHDAEEREAFYRSLLADRRLLVVLDNAADEEQVRPLLPGTPTCGVLVTSRYRLAGLVGMESVNLGVLGTDGALALLDRTAGAGRVRAERAAAEELVRLCGGLPLAIRVVGVKPAMSPHRTLSALVGRLAEERHRLDHLAHAGLAVRSSLDFSYHRIDPTDRMLLRRVSLMDAPDFAGWTAAAVADESVPAVEEGLDRLASAHLVQITGTDVVGQVRYRMHDLIRVYARERAAAEDPEADRLAAIRRALHHWLGLATAGEVTLYVNRYQARIAREIGQVVLDQAALDRVSTDPLTWIEAERAALVSAVRQAAEVDMLGECWRLACVSAMMLGNRELSDDAVIVHSIALDAARRHGDRKGEAVALIALGKTESERSNWARARSLLESAEAMLIGEGDLQVLARCDMELAYLDRYEGKFGSAKDRYTAALRACHDLDPGLEAIALRGMSQIQLFAGDPGAALPLLEAALAVSSRGAGMMPRLHVLVWYGEACLQLGETARAAAAFREVASRAGPVGAVTGELWSLCGLAQIALTEGDIGEAERFAVRAHSLCQTVPDLPTIVRASSTLARVRMAQRLLTAAKELAEGALDNCRRVGAVAYQARMLDLISEIHEAASDHNAAAAARDEAATLLPASLPA
jgi:DNA-binding SARP family transcriptional activator/tetratricopeptide (TPR) repeat protein